jgi:sigma-B regulation protein RsbU (phosphoserine phosphatase)
MLILAYLLISKLINAPIKRLTSDVAQLALGNLDVHVEVTSNDELGLLAQAFNKMTADLKHSIEAHAQERIEKQRINSELDVAAQIQSSMLPSIVPPFPDRKEFDRYASMLPAKEVGGDFYDFFFIDKDNLAVVMADVSGKGIPAALFMVIVKTLIKNTACSGKRPREVFHIVNNMLCENNSNGMFATALMGYYNIPSRKFVFANAGHTPPLVRSGMEYKRLKTKPCLVLGTIENIIYKEEAIILKPGDSLYLYTDGVTEAMDANREFFSEARLYKALKKYKTYPPRELLAAIKQEIDHFVDGAEQSDDITMLSLTVNC